MGRLILPVGSKVYLDSALIIYSVEKNPDYWTIVRDLWQSVDNGDIEVITSELTLLEVLVHPVRNNDENLTKAYNDLLLGPDIQLVPISLAVLTEAVDLRATLNFKTPDAIHAASAILSDCDHLVSNDASFRRLSGLSVSHLADLI